MELAGCVWAREMHIERRQYVWWKRGSEKNGTSKRHLYCLVLILGYVDKGHLVFGFEAFRLGLFCGNY